MSSETETLPLDNSGDRGRQPALSPQERLRVISAFNATAAPYPKDRLIHQLFEEQVDRAADAVAIVYDGEPLTYGALNGRANRLASYLREKGVVPDSLVGICMERGLEMVVGLLAILKAGGAYVPLDPSHPPARLSHMLADAAPGMILTQERLRSALPASRAAVIALDSGWGEIGRHPPDNLAPHGPGLRSNHLAYVIYTSGSTGSRRAR